MPNTLAHYGVQGVATRLLIRDADPKWVFTGCLIPDLPWILRRGIQTLMPGVDPYSLRLYAIAQSSLAGCLVLCGGLALLTRRPRLTFLVLGLNSLLHLLFDAVQVKWGSGFYLAAPFSWATLDFGLFWPESGPTYLLTLFGLIYFSYAWWRRPGKPVTLHLPRSRGLAAASLLLAAYFALPLAMMSGADEADAHWVRTLREPRAGAHVEVDRNEYLSTPKGDFLRTWTKEEYDLEGRLPGESATVSIRGRFSDRDTIFVEDHHVHAGFNRDLMSYAGLIFFLLIWLRALRERTRSPAHSP